MNPPEVQSRFLSRPALLAVLGAWLIVALFAILRDWQAITDIADVYGRDEFIAQGWLGDVEEFAAERIGDVVAVARQSAAIASRKFDSRVSSLRGLHGSTSDLECVIPIARLAR